MTTGFHEKNGQKTEIIDLANPNRKCNILDDIPARAGAVGGILQNQPLICGGVKIGDYYEGNTLNVEIRKYFKIKYDTIF